MNTNHGKYYETYDEVTARRDEGLKKLRQSEPAEPKLETAQV